MSAKCWSGLVALCGLLVTVMAGYKGSGDGTTTGGGDESTILVVGSDTMVNLAQAWAEEYRKKHPEVQVQVRGGGSGRRDRQPDQRHLRHGQRQPQDEGQGDRDRSRRSTGGAEGAHRRLRRPGGLRAQGQPDRSTSPSSSWPRSTGTAGTSRTGPQRVRTRRPSRRDRAGQPPEQLGHVRLLPRGGAWARSGTTSWARSTRAARRTWWPWSGDAGSDRLQRHGLRHAGSQDAEDRQGQGGRGAWPRLWRMPRTAPTRSPGRCRSTRRRADRGSRSIRLDPFAGRTEGGCRTGLRPVDEPMERR